LYRARLRLDAKNTIHAVAIALKTGAISLDQLTSL
jgi:hypothetical protein